MPRGKTHLVKGPCNNKQKVLQFPRFEGFISVEGGGLEGERKRLGWSLQNTPSSSPCLAKCCLQQFGPHHQPCLQPCSSTGPERLERFQAWLCQCSSSLYPSLGSAGCADPPGCPSRSLCSLGTASRHNFKGKILVQGVGGCF